MEEGSVLDDVLKSLRWNGRYQKTRSLVYLTAFTVMVMHSMSLLFIGKIVAHTCQPLDNLTVTLDNITFDIIVNNSNSAFNVSYGECSLDVFNGTGIIYSSECRAGYQYTEPKYSSYVSEWDLVCEKQPLADLSLTISLAGNLAGSLFLSGLADKYGRKITFMISNLLFFITALACSFPLNFESFLVLSFLSRAFVSTTHLCTMVLSVEIMPTEHRALPEQIIAYLWPVSLLICCLVAYLARELNWRYLELILTLLSSYVVVQWWVTDESLHWLLASGKIDEAKKLVRKIAEINRVDPQKALDLIDQYGHKAGQPENDPSNIPLNTIPQKLPSDVDAIVCNQKDTDNEVKVICKSQVADDSLLSFVRNKNLFKLTVISCLLWFADSVTYDGLLLTSSSLANDFYVGFTINVLVEFPAAFLFSLLIDRLGRKKCVSIFHLISGVSLIVSSVLLNAKFAENISACYWIGLMFALLGKMAITAGYSAVFLYTPELFPTSMRNTGYGFSSVAALLGSMISPYSRTLSKQYPWVPSVVFGMLCFAVPVLTTLLPETTGHELPQSVAEMDKWMNDYSKKKTSKIKV
uniref:Major facilitator superfamily (MFS) profile domain-containing protein n=1 Tax=Biomphalaria glabrata TaxID=6526 RepID=A0A2C9L0D8_BIOGL